MNGLATRPIRGRKGAHLGRDPFVFGGFSDDCGHLLAVWSTRMQQWLKNEEKGRSLLLGIKLTNSSPKKEGRLKEQAR